MLIKKNLAFVDLVGEELVSEKILNVGILVECLFDLAQELTSNNAATAKRKKKELNFNKTTV